MSRNKMTKDVIPNDFTLGLVLVDAIPVIFFGGSMVLAGVLFQSLLFIAGALLALFAGVCKVLWKLIVVLKKKNIWWMFLQMRICMPIGFVLMLAGGITSKADLSIYKSIISSFPVLAFFIAGAVGMCLMLVFGFTLDSSDVKSNWIEQITNGLAQICFFIGLLLMVI